MVFATVIVEFVLSLLPAFVLLGKVGLLEFAWLIAFCGFTLIVAFTLTFLVGRVAIVCVSSGRPKLQTALTFVWSVLILVGLVVPTSNLTNLPVPTWTTVRAEAAASMRATIGDMATFLIELSNPQRLSAQTAAQLQMPQIKLSSDLSWGLGPGIQRSPQGDALWQWGQHVDFQSTMMIYPEHGFGVVVCTNSDLLSPDVAIEIAHRALGGKIEPVRQAIHLAFNYRERDRPRE